MFSQLDIPTTLALQCLNPVMCTVQNFLVQPAFGPPFRMYIDALALQRSLQRTAVAFRWLI